MSQVPLPYDPLTPLDPKEMITAQAVRRLRHELYTNAAQMKTTLGGGRHGHLGLLMPPDLYQSLSSIPYTLPDTPPVRPTRPMPPPSPQQLGRLTATSPSRRWASLTSWFLPHQAPDPHGEDADHTDIPFMETLQEFKEDLDAWKEEKETWKAAQEFSQRMVTLLIAAVPETYLIAFKQAGSGYADANPGAILRTLVTKYGTITREELQQNRDRLRAPWDPDTPIETLFYHAGECRNFAQEGGDPIPDGQYVQAIVATIKASGVLANAVYDWKTYLEEEQTAQYMVYHFTLADRVRREDNTAMRATLTANSAALPPTSPGAQPSSATFPWKYCWSHGLGKHGSDECTSPATNHVRTATLTNWDRHGGNTNMHKPRYFKQVYKAPPQSKHRAAKRARSSPSPTNQVKTEPTE
jgi:hypothetical protein